MAKKRIPSLIVEPVSDSGNLYFLSVIEYKRENYLTVVNNIDEEEIGAYVLDFAQQERLNMQQLMSAITLWFYKGSFTHPLSFEFSRLGLTPLTNRIYKSFELTHVTRLVGNDFRYNLSAQPKIRRRRASMIPAGVEVHLKRSPIKSGDIVHGVFQAAKAQLEPQALQSEHGTQTSPEQPESAHQAEAAKL